jgi:hypothetical protein
MAGYDIGLKWTLCTDNPSQGAVSVLIVTFVEPQSVKHGALLEMIRQMASQTVLPGLSLHILHSNPLADDSPNAFLNLAMLFASTSRVVLFPGGFSMLPPIAYGSLLPHSSPEKFTVLSNGKESSPPFLPLAPVMLPRGRSFWCNERFFFSSSRVVNWNECVWQIWLWNFEEVDILEIPSWPEVGSPRATSLQRQLVAKYRSEACDLTFKQVSTLVDRRGAKKKARFLKQFCR